jgi:hypothetical protein
MIITLNIVIFETPPSKTIWIYKRAMIRLRIQNPCIFFCHEGLALGTILLTIFCWIPVPGYAVIGILFELGISQPLLWIRIGKDPKLFAGFGSVTRDYGSGFGSETGLKSY